MANELRDALIRTAQQVGIDPVDLGTVISYETAGTFDPWKAGPTTQWGQHRGLIQWGEPQRQRYGVFEGMPIPAQMDAVGKYLVDAGVKPGMGLLDVYSAVNAGRVGRYGASDANNGGAPGTVRDKVEQQMSGHRAKAASLLGGTWAQYPPQASGTPAPPLGPGVQIDGPPAPAMAAQPAPEESGLGDIFAAFMGGAGGGIAPQAPAPGPQGVHTGDPMAATMAAMASADRARGLAAGLAPDIEALLGLGKRKAAPLVG